MLFDALIYVNYTTICSVSQNKTTLLSSLGETKV